MRLSTRKLFKQPDDRRKAMPVLEDPFRVLFNEWPTAHPKNSLGYFADQLGLPVNLLIEQFSEAGIKETGEVLMSFSMLTVNADALPLMKRFHRPEDEK